MSPSSKPTSAKLSSIERDKIREALRLVLTGCGEETRASIAKRIQTLRKQIDEVNEKRRGVSKTVADLEEVEKISSDTNLPMGELLSPMLKVAIGEFREKIEEMDPRDLLDEKSKLQRLLERLLLRSRLAELLLRQIGELSRGD